MFFPVSVDHTPIQYEDLLAFADALEDMSEPLGLIGDRFLIGISEQFSTEGQWGNEPWPPLTEKYRQWKEARAPGTPMLVGLRRSSSKGSYTVSGKMRAELLNKSSIKVTNHLMSYLPVSDIAVYHQEGTDDMPARPPVAVPMREISQWDVIMDDWVTSLAERTLL